MRHVHTYKSFKHSWIYLWIHFQAEAGDAVVEVFPLFFSFLSFFFFAKYDFADTKPIYLSTLLCSRALVIRRGYLCIRARLLIFPRDFFGQDKP